VWSLDTLQRLKTLTGHTDAVRALAINGGRLFSGSYDGSVKVSAFSRFPSLSSSASLLSVLSSAVHDAHIIYEVCNCFRALVNTHCPHILRSTALHNRLHKQARTRSYCIRTVSHAGQRSGTSAPWSA